jgi:hypothetical protein
MCECLPERDIPDQFFSVHFSCINGASEERVYPAGPSSPQDASHTGLTRCQFAYASSSLHLHHHYHEHRASEARGLRERA